VNADIVALANECTFGSHPVIVCIVIAIAQLPGSVWFILGGLEHGVKGRNEFIEWISYDIAVKHDGNNNNIYYIVIILILNEMHINTIYGCNETHVHHESTA
jgi:hypothetical protein